MTVARRAAAVLLGALVATGPAAAGDDVLTPGTTVRITALGHKDAFWRYRKTLVGVACAVGDPGLVVNNGRFYGGPLTCADGETYYFYQVAVEVGDFGFRLPDPAGTAAEADGAGPPAAPDVASPFPVSPFPVQMRVRIRDLSSADAHFENLATLRGRECTVGEAPLTPSGDGWVSGELRCSGGADLYFYQVAVEALGPASASTGSAAGGSTTPAGATAGVAGGAPAHGVEIAPGKLVKVVDLAPADALYPTRAALVGHTCSVVEAALVPSGDGVYAGRLFCDDGKSWQVFKATVAVP